MTRPGYVLVEYTPEEAAAVLERLRTEDPRWLDSDPDLVSGTERLERAIRVERGPGGSSAGCQDAEPALGKAA